MSTVQRYGTSINAGLNRFDAGCCARRQKSKHPIPVVGWPETKAEQILVFRLYRCLPHQMPDLSRRPMIDPPDGGVESSNASEARGNRQLAHRQRGFVDQLFCEVQTPRVSDRTGRCPQMSQEQAPKMTGPNAQPFCQSFHAAIFQTTLADQAQSPRNGVRSPEPGRSSGRTFWPTSETRPEARLRSRGGTRKVTDVFLLSSWCGTNRTAVNAATEHADKKLPIKSRIT